MERCGHGCLEHLSKQKQDCMLRILNGKKKHLNPIFQHYFIYMVINGMDPSMKSLMLNLLLLLVDVWLRLGVLLKCYELGLKIFLEKDHRLNLCLFQMKYAFNTYC